MKAIVRTRYGDTSVLETNEVETPPTEEGRVIIRVGAAGVNMAEWHLMTGEPRLMRLATGLRRPKKPGLGGDVAGVVVSTGPGVSRFAVGDSVFGAGRFTWAQFASAKEEMLQPIPVGVTFEQAAAVPMAGYTALQALRRCGPLENARVAVTGAGGGVGSMLVQLATANGARVTAICSGSKADFVRQLGAHEVIDYTNTDPTQVLERFDSVLDFAGGLPLRKWKRAITPGGILVLGGGETGGKMLGPLLRSMRAPFVRGIKVVTLMATAHSSDIAELATALRSGALTSPHTTSFPLKDAAAAVQSMRSASHAGKIVLIP